MKRVGCVGSAREGRGISDGTAGGCIRKGHGYLLPPPVLSFFPCPVLSPSLLPLPHRPAPQCIYSTTPFPLVTFRPHLGLSGKGRGLHRDVVEGLQYSSCMERGVPVAALKDQHAE